MDFREKAEIWDEAKQVFLIFTCIFLLLALTVELGVNPFDYYLIYWSLALLGVLGIYTSAEMQYRYEESAENV